MKHLKTVFNTLFGLLLLLFSGAYTPVYAQESTVEDILPDPMDSVEISLLTCQPHDEIYSLYGHTAIRVLRFVFGLTDYELGVYPFNIFLKEYRHFGSMVTEQVLNLTSEEKLLLHEALRQNLQPGNSVYRYNYFYNNCTTKARDIIEKCITGKTEYAEREDFTPTYREMVHEMTRNHPWARFGNDLLLGIKADQPTTLRQQEFLPYNLMYDFDHAQIYENGQYRPLVKERRTALPGGVQIVKQGFPLSPIACAILLTVTGLILLILQWRSKRSFLFWDILLMLTIGTLRYSLSALCSSNTQRVFGVWHYVCSCNVIFT